MPAQMAAARPMKARREIEELLQVLLMRVSFPQIF
jgi:hypothetical protein